mmetsp:Transcript_20594/g.44827  ORF Transcript_20594/g.44827 Transcript_20594/m.44827 type:complete len:236 (-) Transcript_20594:1290-1997(-)
MQMQVMPTLAKRAPFTMWPFALVVSNILEMEHSSSQVWAWNMAWKPAVIMRVLSGISAIYIWQMILSTDLQAGCVHITNPLRISSVEAPLSLTRIFSPGRAAATGSSLAQTESTLNSARVGIKVTFCPGRTTPLSTLPMAMVPRSVYRSKIGTRSGADASRPLISKESRRPISVDTFVLFSPLCQLSFHHEQIDESTSSLTLFPFNPDIGMNLTSRFITNPHPFKKGRSFCTHSS